MAPGGTGRRRANPPTLLLVGRTGCHLCDDAREVLRRVGADLGIGFEERDVDADPALLAAWAELVPVLLIDGIEHAHWRLDEQQLRTALAPYTPS